MKYIIIFFILILSFNVNSGVSVMTHEKQKFIETDKSSTAKQSHVRTFINPAGALVLPVILEDLLNGTSYSSVRSTYNNGVEDLHFIDSSGITQKEFNITYSGVGWTLTEVIGNILQEGSSTDAILAEDGTYIKQES